MKSGVSVIICCYNSEDRILDTLKYLECQVLNENIGMEVIVVDNNCTDHTVYLVEEFRKNATKAIRVVKESTPGLSYARNRGVKESTFNYLIFCDDDNWLNPYYVFNAYVYLNMGYSIVGGEGKATFSITPPDWFKNNEKAYACGKQQSNKPVYGAGLCIKKTFIEQLQQMGWSNVISDRVKDKLISGGDTELCYMALLLKHKIFVPENGLEFFHAIPKNRLSKNYIESFHYWNGYSSFILSSYEDLLLGNTSFIGFFPIWWLKRFLYLFLMKCKITIGITTALQPLGFSGYFTSFLKNSTSVYNHTVLLKNQVFNNY
ncbi:MAG: glycosyltransferase [Cytophagaceae bacterium]|jgi:glycosyltransferase involved in cell wall biosynthesis|nr:glycosyltransferase [Cytophagaceae bacterium]